ncbi:hypothetical protein LCGC14_0560490 [marine sediment metagenome]|uniref:DUF2721 domain-containing protein n=1 Tax=marine sediment metagenome TaxID=412755 RepID=A0A0F9RM08_9ZZZZ|nr:DUF2721 domain-containing protein [Methylophaga sp.]HEC59334.1 DUF2721 domain-containing protein [Methylophaga sp.]
MFTFLSNLGDVNHAVQLALTPAFLLTGMAGILSVMANRLARIIDRGRDLTENFSTARGLSDQDKYEFDCLELRRHSASMAISMCVWSCLLVCSVVSVMFIEALMNFSLKWLIGAFFMASTLSLIIGLAFFLHEVRLATRSVRILTFPIQNDSEHE